MSPKDTKPPEPGEPRPSPDNEEQAAESLRSRIAAIYGVTEDPLNHPLGPTPRMKSNIRPGTVTVILRPPALDQPSHFANPPPTPDDVAPFPEHFGKLGSSFLEGLSSDEQDSVVEAMYATWLHGQEKKR